MSLDNYTRLINNYGLNKKNTKDKKIVPTTTKPLDVYQRKIGNNTVAGNGVGNGTIINKEPETVVGTTPTTTPETTNSATTNTTVGTTPTTTGSATVDDSWKAIQQQIKMNTLNSKNEVAMAQRQASKNMDNYLKSLGIYGTGLGQSSYVDLATQYANQLADINADERTALLEAQQTQNAEVKELIEKGADPMAIQQVISELKAQGFNTSEIERYQKAMGQDIETHAKSLYGAMIDEMKLEDFSGDKNQYNQAITMLENAITSGDSKAMSEAYDYAYNVSNRTPNLNNKVDTNGNVIPSSVGNQESLNRVESFKKDKKSTVVSFDDIKSINNTLANAVIDIKLGQISENDNVDNDFDIDIRIDGFGGKNYDVDVDWVSSDKGAPQAPSQAKWDKAMQYLSTLNPSSDTLVVYNDRVWIYQKNLNRWGCLQRGKGGSEYGLFGEVGGERLYEDLMEAINGGTPNRWKTKNQG